MSGLRSTAHLELFQTFGLFVALFLSTSALTMAQSTRPTFSSDTILQAVAERVTSRLDDYPVEEDGIPRSVRAEGSVAAVTPRDWTSGFFPGILWQIYAFDPDPSLRSSAEAWTALLERESREAKDHDIGFRINCSYGLGWQITQDSTYRSVILQAARALAERFNERVGAIKSWDYDQRGWQYPVIIDNMMNLELLFAASRLGGDSTLYDVAVRHAETTMRNHFRDDGSSYHVIDYDPETGVVLQRHTHQGAADSSAWARGQSWGLYGFTMTYRETRDTRFLKQAQSIADFLLSHPNLPADGVPYWDYDAPEIPDAERDASAGAIMASALYELSGYVPDPLRTRYRDAAALTVASLWRDYRARDEEWPFLLTGSVGNMNIFSEVGVPIVYADYYFVEAVRRQRAVGM